MKNMPQPPYKLSDEAMNAWRRIYAFHVRRGTWRPEYALGMAVVVQSCAVYIQIERTLHGLAPDHPARSGLEASVEETRQLARRALEEWPYIKPERSRLAVMNAGGLDSDIVAVCAPIAPDELPPD